MSTSEARPLSTTAPKPPRPAPAGRAPSARAPRRARLVLSRVDPWSVLKLSALLSICLGIVLVVAVAVLWSVLNGMGVFDSVSKTISDVTKDASGSSQSIDQWLSLSRVLTVAGIVAAVDAVLITALATLTAFIYNVSAAVVGGLHLTLTED
ncbi:transmembrane protein DUF3566 [Motilibacter rhizosphaerae]|uniref:Transmembrane protein DUF3566 n=1 Tax=Motilibacter rhizosphaerae TaxID=598652 RepID=A0A4Q7NVE8_9ACTN|nr:DUF3566 domain-containing protein [Motilibacter rhizosphaerae]RZS91236.1 transmembrane protein DUF3566 [Motilibacter rhizosphaerae]